jgi:enoyl-CoA hydratase
LFEQHTQDVFEFKLNAPKALNSLDLEMVDLMLSKVQKWHKDPNHAPRIALISGMGEKAFCAGGDIKNIYDSGNGKADPSIKHEFFAREYLLDYSLT